MHLVPDTGKSVVNDGRVPNVGIEPMPKIDVVVGAVCVCGTLASKNSKNLQMYNDCFLHQLKSKSTRIFNTDLSIGQVNRTTRLING